MNSKPWWASKTLWTNAVAGLASLLLVLAPDLPLGPDTQASIVGGVMAVINILLRLISHKSITKGKT